MEISRHCFSHSVLNLFQKDCGRYEVIKNHDVVYHKVLSDVCPIVFDDYFSHHHRF